MLLLRDFYVDAFLALLLTLCSCQYVKGDLYYEHTKLLQDLFQDYDKISRPSPGSVYPVNVTLGIAVAQLVKVEEKMEGMNLNVWYRMAWNDYRLRWNPQRYGNITNFKVDSDYLWTPDIMLSKPLTSEAGQVLGVKKHDDDLAWKISVSNDGTATFNFPGSINGQCSLTISDYPYDEHKCSFLFSSWVHDGSELILRLRPSNSLDFGNYIHNNEWHIVGAEPKNVAEKYDCCPAPFYMTSFNIHVRRGASSYVSNYIIPSILIAVLSIMMFTLPPEVGKRMEIGINLLLCLSVYLTILNTKMPTRSDAFPLLSKFYGCCIFILTCALLCTCWVVAYYFHDMSGWEIYSMSKFVEVGILKYLRRALRFPNANKIFPSDILESVNTQRTIEVKPMTMEKTNFGSDPPAKAPDGETMPPKEDAKKETEKKEKSQALTKQPNPVEENEKPDKTESKNQNKDSLSQIKKQEIVSVQTKDIDSNKEEMVYEKEVKMVEATTGAVVEKTTPKEDPTSENKIKDSKKKNTKAGKKVEHRTRDKSEGGEGNKVKKKSRAPKQDKDAVKCDETPRMSDTSEKTRMPRSASRESDTSQTSRKSNNVFGEKITAGLVEKPKKERRRRKTKKEDLGVVNVGANNEENKSKIGTSTDKNSGEKEDKKASDVRESPSLKDSKGETKIDEKPSGEVSALVEKPSISDKTAAFLDDDKAFDAKQEVKKKHDSIKLLKELSQYFSDHLERKKKRYQWRQAATVLNRLFLIILCFSITMSVIVVFLVR